MEGVIVPVDNAEEASAVEGIEVYPADTLASVVGFLNEQHEIEPLSCDSSDDAFSDRHMSMDFADIRGQEAVKRAAAIAAAAPTIC